MLQIWQETVCTYITNLGKFLLNDCIASGYPNILFLMYSSPHRPFNYLASFNGEDYFILLLSWAYTSTLMMEWHYSESSVNFYLLAQRHVSHLNEMNLT
jgi:hypothetical protein